MLLFEDSLGSFSVIATMMSNQRCELVALRSGECRANEDDGKIRVQPHSTNSPLRSIISFKLYPSSSLVSHTKTHSS